MCVIGVRAGYHGDGAVQWQRGLCGVNLLAHVIERKQIRNSTRWNSKELIGCLATLVV